MLPANEKLLYATYRRVHSVRGAPSLRYRTRGYRSGNVEPRSVSYGSSTVPAFRGPRLRNPGDRCRMMQIRVFIHRRLHVRRRPVCNIALCYARIHRADQHIVLLLSDWRFKHVWVIFYLQRRVYSRRQKCFDSVLRRAHFSRLSRAYVIKVIGNHDSPKSMSVLWCRNYLNLHFRYETHKYLGATHHPHRKCFQQHYQWRLVYDTCTCRGRIWTKLLPSTSVVVALAKASASLLSLSFSLASIPRFTSSRFSLRRLIDTRIDCCHRDTFPTTGRQWPRNGAFATMQIQICK